MPNLVDMRVIGLLCSHLCHELVNPLGAVNNGIELLLDVGDDMRDEALALVESSAMRTTKRVQFYRMAYGMAGMTTLGQLAEVRQLADDLLGEGRLTLEWPDAERNPTLEQGLGRMLLNMTAAAAETLPRGGVLTVAIGQSADAPLLSVVARGERARVEESTRPIFAGDVAFDSLTARNVHSYYTMRVADTIGGRLEVVDSGAGEIRFAFFRN